jgi:hypothetical protein
MAEIDYPKITNDSLQVIRVSYDFQSNISNNKKKLLAEQEGWQKIYEGEDTIVRDKKLPECPINCVRAEGVINANAKDLWGKNRYALSDFLNFCQIL